MLSHIAWVGRDEVVEDGGRLVDFLGRKGEKCLRRRRGPIVLVEKVWRSCW